MQVNVEQRRAREITFSVTEDEAHSVAQWLRDALRSNINTPAASVGVQKVQQAFATVAEGREFRGN